MITLKPGFVGDDNLDGFNRLALSLFVCLYEAFPHEALINVKDFLESDSEENLSLMDGTMLFLRREGFLVYRDEAGEGMIFLGVQLTLKGFEILGKSPSSLEKGETLITKIKDYLKIGSKEVLKEGVKLVLTEATR